MTKLPRIQVVLKPSSSACVLRIAALTEQSRSAIVSQIVQASLPALTRMLQHLEEAGSQWDLRNGALYGALPSASRAAAARGTPPSNRGVRPPPKRRKGRGR